MKKQVKTSIMLGLVVFFCIFVVTAYGWASDEELLLSSSYSRLGNNEKADLTAKQRGQIQEIAKKLHDNTAELREKIWTKSQALRTLLNESDPDRYEAKALQADISALKAKLAQKKIDFQLEVRKIALYAKTQEEASGDSAQR